MRRDFKISMYSFIKKQIAQTCVVLNGLKQNIGNFRHFKNNTAGMNSFKQLSKSHLLSSKLNKVTKHLIDNKANCSVESSLRWTSDEGNDQGDSNQLSSISDEAGFNSRSAHQV
jgi:hypothetical protein